MNGLPEGTPILCRGCGGRMDLQPDASASCGFCGARDRLPDDQLGRVLEIKNRLAMAEQRAAQVRGFDVALAGIFENPDSLRRVTGFYLVFAIGITVMSLVSLISALWGHFGVLDAGSLFQMFVAQAMAPILLVGFSISLGVSLLHGRSLYRSKVRPILLARAPAQAGAPFRCRACGGDLPTARSADVPCSYCRTLNLVPAELHGAHAAALFREAEDARGQLQKASGAFMSISKTMSRTLLVCGVVTFVLGYGLPMLAMAIVG